MRDFVKAGFVTLRDDAAGMARTSVYRDCMIDHRHKYNWIAFIDTDEFIVIRKPCDPSFPISRIVYARVIHTVLILFFQTQNRFWAPRRTWTHDGNSLAKHMQELDARRCAEQIQVSTWTGSSSAQYGVVGSLEKASTWWGLETVQAVQSARLAHN